MQVLTYDRLFEFLQSKYVINHTEKTDEHIIDPVVKKLSSISETFDEYLNAISYVEMDIDKRLSIYAGVLYLLKTDFILLNKKNVYIEVFLEKVLNDIASEKLYEIFGHTKNIFKTKDDLIGLKQEHQLIFMSHYFDINILVFNLDIARVEAVYLDKMFNKFRNTVLLLKSENMYYPIIYNNTTMKKNILLHNNTSDILETIINVLRTEIKPIDINKKQFDIGGNDIFEDVNLGNNYTEIDDIDGGVGIDIKEKTVSDILVDKGDIFLTKKSKPNFTNKMKVDEIKKIAQEYKIDLKFKDPKTGKTKMKTKTQLCQELSKL